MMTPPPRMCRGTGWLNLGIGLLGLALATPSWGLPTEGQVVVGTENNNIGVGISSGAIIEKTGAGGTVVINSVP